MRADGAHLDEATGVFGRQFVKGAMRLEEIALGANFTRDAQRQRGLVGKGGVAEREAPAVAGVVDHEDARGVR